MNYEILNYHNDWALISSVLWAFATQLMAHLEILIIFITHSEKSARHCTKFKWFEFFNIQISQIKANGKFLQKIK